MKTPIITLAILLTGIAYLSAQQPGKLPTIPMSREAAATRALLESQYENLRINICWEAGVSKDECGPWTMDGVLRRVPTAAAKPIVPAPSAPSVDAKPLAPPKQ